MSNQEISKAEAELARLLMAARGPEVPVPSALMERVLADAADVQKDLAQPAPTPPRPSLLKRFIESLGGWQGMSALTASACVGLVVGLSAPDAVAAYLPGFEVAAEDQDVFLGVDFLEDDA